MHFRDYFQLFSKDLTCDFSKRALNCQWANLEQLPEGMSYWEIGILGNDKLTKNTRNLLPGVKTP